MDKQQFFLESTVELDLQAGEGDGKKLPTVSMLAYGGGRMRPNGWSTDVVVDLSTVKASRTTIPLLFNHDREVDSIVGHGKVTVDGKQIRATGTISGVGDAAKKVVEMSRNGYEWQASIGARPGKLEFVEDGKTALVNGQQYEGPVYVARNTKIHEVSFVAIGADQETDVSVAAAAQQEESEMSKQVDAASSQTTAAATPQINAEAEVKQLREQLAAEQKRVAQIQKVCGARHELATKAIEAGTSVEQVELEVLRAELEEIRKARPASSGPAIHSQSEQDATASVIQCSLLRTHHVPEEVIAKDYDEKTRNIAGEQRFRHFSLHRLMHTVLHAAGLQYPIGQADNDFIRKTFQASQKLEATGGAFSTLSLPGILGDVANKRLLASYTMYPSVIPFFCAQQSATDFKILYSYRLEGDGKLEKVGPDGEIKHGKMVESEYTNRLDTYAKMLALTRTMLINDDLGAFMQIVAKLGEMAYKAHELAGINLLNSPGGGFYASGHNNLLIGSGSALSIDALTDAVIEFASQTDTEGYPISVDPDRILVPTDLKVTASQLMTTATVIDGSSSTLQPSSNPHAGAFALRSSPWLSNTLVTGNSATAWYMFANPASLAAFAVAYLRGNSNPTVESSEMDFNKLGMQWRSYFDFGFGTVDWRGVVKSTGGSASS